MTRVATTQDFSVSIYRSSDDDEFVARCPEFPGLSAFGTTAVAAWQELQTVLEAAIETYVHDGRELPAPLSHEPPELPSGEFRVRIARTMHQRLRQQASLEGMSQNRLVSDYIAAGLAQAEALARHRGVSVPFFQDAPEPHR